MALIGVATTYDVFFREDFILRELWTLAKKYNRQVKGEQQGQMQFHRLSSIASISSTADLLSFE
jgi:hypothetical protein